MSKNKYEYEVTDIHALEAFAKNAVANIKKPLRGKITAMLDAGVEVPGILVTRRPTEADIIAAKTAKKTKK